MFCLAIQAFFDRAAAGFGFMSWAGRHEASLEQGGQFVETGLLVVELTTRIGAVNDELAFGQVWTSMLNQASHRRAGQVHG